MVAGLHYGDHFTLYGNVKSLCCTPEANIMLYVNYPSIDKKKKTQNSLCQEKRKTFFSPFCPPQATCVMFLYLLGCLHFKDTIRFTDSRNRKRMKVSFWGFWDNSYLKFFFVLGVRSQGAFPQFPHPSPEDAPLHSHHFPKDSAC